MRYVTGLLAALACAAAVAAADRIPLDRAQQFAKLLTEYVAKIDNPQIKTDVDTEKPSGITAEQKYGALVVPDRNLTEDAIAKADKEVKPVGHLWTRNLVPAVDNAALPNDKLRIVAVTIENNEHMLPF